MDVNSLDFKNPIFVTISSFTKYSEKITNLWEFYLKINQTKYRIVQGLICFKYFVLASITTWHPWGMEPKVVSMVGSFLTHHWTDWISRLHFWSFFLQINKWDYFFPASFTVTCTKLTLVAFFSDAKWNYLYLRTVSFLCYRPQKILITIYTVTSY